MHKHIAILGLALYVLGGCSDALETGYIPRKLNATDPERRAYYASKFSPEANVEKSSNTAAPAPMSPRAR